MHAGNRHPVTLYYRLPIWNAFYYIRNFAEEFWTSFCRRFSRTDTPWTSNTQVKEAFVFVSRKKKGRQLDSSKQAGCHTTSYKLSQHPEGRKPDNVSLSTFIGWLTSHVSVETLGVIRRLLIILSFSGHGIYFFKGSIHTILFYSIRVTIWRHRRGCFAATRRCR